jgi:hypothetical protein
MPRRAEALPITRSLPERRPIMSGAASCTTRAAAPGAVRSVVLVMTVAPCSAKT